MHTPENVYAYASERLCARLNTFMHTPETSQTCVNKTQNFAKLCVFTELPSVRLQNNNNVQMIVARLENLSYLCAVYECRQTYLGSV